MVVDSTLLCLTLFFPHAVVQMRISSTRADAMVQVGGILMPLMRRSMAIAEDVDRY